MMRYKRICPHAYFSAVFYFGLQPMEFTHTLHGHFKKNASNSNAGKYEKYIRWKLSRPLNYLQHEHKHMYI